MLNLQLTTHNIQPTTYNLRPAAHNPHRSAIALAILIFAALSIWQAVASEGFLEADGCTHYMYARWAFTYPVYFVDIWGRPLKTLLYAPAAATIGLIGVRLTSLAVAIGIAFIAYTIARRQNYRWPALALIFTLAQPLLFLHSFSELTELPFAMFLGLAFLAYQRKAWWAVTLIAGFLPLSRPEGFGFIGLTAVLLVCHRKWFWLPLLFVPVMGWQIAGALMYREPQNWWNWLPKHWPYAGDSLYAKGSIGHFAGLLPAVVGPILFPFVLIGLWRSGSACHPERTRDRPVGSSDAMSPDDVANESASPGRSLSRLGSFGMTIARFRESHALRIDVLIAVIPLMILVGHSVLYALGKMASNGELRYMLIVAPFWALLATRGWEWVWERWIELPIADCRLPIERPTNETFSREAAAESSLGRKPQESVESNERPDGAKAGHEKLPIASVAPAGLGATPGQPGADAPGYSLTTLRGWESRLRDWRSPFRWAAVAAIAPVFANLGYKVLPLVQTEDWKTAARIADWYKTSGVAKDYPYMMAAHPAVTYALDRAPLDPMFIEWNRQNVLDRPNGTIVVWDWVYGMHNADKSKSVERVPIGKNWWIPDFEVEDMLIPPDGRTRTAKYGGEHPSWGIFFSPQTISEHATPTKREIWFRVKKW